MDKNDQIWMYELVSSLAVIPGAELRVVLV
jgi:hypothetical protein